MLILYEHLLTLEDELELIWRRKLKPSSWMFLMNRSVLVLGILDLLLASFGATVRVLVPLHCTVNLTKSFRRRFASSDRPSLISYPF